MVSSFSHPAETCRNIQRQRATRRSLRHGRDEIGTFKFRQFPGCPEKSTVQI